jgi:RNA-directed DNA polymerase
MIRAWLKAGVVEDGQYAPTQQGAPQGGLCSAEHNPPYEQRWAMRSVGEFASVGRVPPAERCA